MPEEIISHRLSWITGRDRIFPAPEAFVAPSCQRKNRAIRAPPNPDPEPIFPVGPIANRRTDCNKTIIAPTQPPACYWNFPAFLAIFNDCNMGRIVTQLNGGLGWGRFQIKRSDEYDSEKSKGKKEVLFIHCRGKPARPGIHRLHQRQINRRISKGVRT